MTDFNLSGESDAHSFAEAALNASPRDLHQPIARGMIEALIDRLGADDVLHQLAAVMNAKAAHITENWQDDSTAGLWTDYARAVSRVKTRGI